MEPDIGGQRVEGDQQNPALLGDKAQMADGLTILYRLEFVSFEYVDRCTLSIQ